MKYFKLSEFIRSASAERMNLLNLPDFEEVENLRALCEVILDPLREAWGAPILVSSGFRCEALNKAVGGVPNSQHLVGQAADIVPVGGSPDDVRRLFNGVLDLKLPFDQLINESNFSWLHVSYRRNGKNRGVVLSL